MLKWSQPDSLMSSQKVAWIHPDAQLSPDAGICYGVRYIGCLEIKESMKSLDFETRTAVARESISRVAEAAGLKTTTKRKKVDRRLGKMLGEAPHLQHAGSNVNLTITTESINLMVMDSGEIIADHPLHVVSFASGGDMDTVDFVSYVAKDPEYGRACHVLECGGGLAEDVVSTIGQAFELRFKQYLKKQPKAVQLPDKHDKSGFEDERWGNTEEYYNDNPEAVPPDLNLPVDVAPPEIPQIPEYNPSSKTQSSRHDRLINEVATGSQVHDNRAETLIVDLPPAPEPPPSSPHKPSHKEGETDLRASRSTASTGTLEPVFEEWYHGDLSRKQAESLLEFDGDFLVRKSTNSPGQFVLSGKQAGAPRHLLLVDPEGIVRTRDFIFDSVSHLINYHRQNNLPIVTQGSELQLVRPVKKCTSAI